LGVPGRYSGREKRLQERRAILFCMDHSLASALPSIKGTGLMGLTLELTEDGGKGNCSHKKPQLCGRREALVFMHLRESRK
jgi:hypothetical protein